MPNNTVIGYTYDAQGRLIAKRVNGVVTKRWLYDGQLRPVAELAADGDVERYYLYALHANVPEAVIESDGTVYRIITDHLGSPRMVVNTVTGEIVKELSFDEFGNITSETGTYSIPFGFAGGIRDTDTNLTKFGARWYDPETGRWLEKEPLGFAGSNNFYSYVNGDPVNFVDVTGLFTNPLSDDLMMLRTYTGGKYAPQKNLFGEGIRVDINGRRRSHQGVDLFALIGTDTNAVGNGKIISIRNSGSYGLSVLYEFAYNYSNTEYLSDLMNGVDSETIKLRLERNGMQFYAFHAHLSDIDSNLKEGSEILEGQPLGRTGISGNASNLPEAERHLHFEIRTQPLVGLGTTGRLDPMEFLYNVNIF